MSGIRVGEFWRAEPPAYLATDVVAFLGRRSKVMHSGFDVFPNAQPELLFHFADPFYVGPLHSAASTALSRATLLGPRTERYRQRAGPRIEWFIVQLTPSGCRRFLGATFRSLVGQDVPLSDLVGASADAAWEQMAAQTDFASRVRIASHWLAHQIPQAHRRGDAEISALATASRNRPLVRVDEMARLLDQSARRLHQRFVSELGVSPKAWLSMMRAHRYLRTLHPETEDVDFEFSDDSHAIREFKRYSGLTPGEYRAIKLLGDPLVNTGPARAE